MIVKKLDFLSPKITLYFKGTYKHSSVFSGIITIISYLIILIFIVYYTLDFIDRGNPTIYFFNRYVEDAGSFPLNRSSVFHYINQISTSRNIRNLTFDFNSISIYGLTRSIDSYFQNSDFTKINHWVYNICDEKDYDSVKNFVDRKTFLQSACIEKYYNLKDNKYHFIGESGFEWPSLDHGISNPNRTIYGIIIETCQNNSLKNTCNSINTINSYFSKYAIAVNFIDQYADVLNYKEPFTKYINSISDAMTLGTTVTINNLNFNPSLTRTHNGFFFDNLVQERSYSFVQNDKKNVDIKEGQNIVVAFYFYMQNNMTYNERYYKKFQELLSNLGGLGSFILLVGFFINSLVSYYIVLLDTEDLVFNIEKLNFDKDNQVKNKTTIIKDKETVYNIYKRNNKTNFENSNVFLFFTDASKNETYKNEEPFTFLSKRNKIINNINKINYSNLNQIAKNYSYSNLSNSKIFKDYKKVKEVKIEKSNSENLIRRFNPEKTFFEIKDKKNKIIPKPQKKHNFTWLNFILYFISFKSKNDKMKFYEKFRAQILSEENCLQNSLDIYKLLKFCNIQKTNLF